MSICYIYIINASKQNTLPSQHFARRALRLLSFSPHSDEKKCPLILLSPLRGRIPTTFLWFPRESRWIMAWLLEVSSTVTGFFGLHNLRFLCVGATCTKSGNRKYNERRTIKHQKIFFAKIIKLILWSNLAKKFFDLIKSSNFYGPSKPSFQWFATAHGESGESESCDVKSRMNASAVPVRSSILHECEELFCCTSFSLGLHSQQISVFSADVFYFIGFQNEFWLGRLKFITSLKTWNRTTRWRPSWFICWSLAEHPATQPLAN